MIRRRPSGVNVSIRQDQDIEGIQGKIRWLDASLKYGPFGLLESGPAEIRSDYTITKFAKEGKFHIRFDTLVTRGEDIIKYCQALHSFDSDECRDSIYTCLPGTTSTTCYENAKSRLTLAFGLMHAPSLDMSQASLVLKSNATAIYIRAIGKLVSIDVGKLSIGTNLGLGLSYLTLGGAEAYITRDGTDTLGVARMAPESTFSPQVFGGLFISYDGFAVFGDFGYEYTKFSNLKFDDMDEELPITAYRGALPREKKLSTTFFRLGASLTIN